ncbi:MAG: methyltransferase domain-containing protein [Euzebyales bacterium]|nr:methyltransferase domain-containing protein [Euzebyales bacterium]
MATFDASAAQRLGRAYATPHVVAQRARTRQAVAPRPGQRILDVGCGPGLLACELAAAVGPAGTVIAIDTSEQMLGAAAQRATQDGVVEWTRFARADATALPVADGCLHAVTGTQVYEYVPDLARAFAEIARVLRPGGRVAIVDTDWDSCVWHASDRRRTRRVLEAWRGHFTHPDLPARLPALLAGADLRLESLVALPLVDISYDADAFSRWMLGTVAEFVGARGGLTPDEAHAWADDVRAQQTRGGYFFSVCRYLALARR